jgi:hypothetical protein
MAACGCTTSLLRRLNAVAQGDVLVGRFGDRRDSAQNSQKTPKPCRIMKATKAAGQTNRLN